jgi:hypothetical protein
MPTKKSARRKRVTEAEIWAAFVVVYAKRGYVDFDDPPDWDPKLLRALGEVMATNFALNVDCSMSGVPVKTLRKMCFAHFKSYVGKSASAKGP